MVESNGLSFQTEIKKCFYIFAVFTNGTVQLDLARAKQLSELPDQHLLLL
jgi:hypothetical protein